MIRIATLGVQNEAVIAGISGAAVSGTAVVVDGISQLGTIVATIQGQH
jgi:hypothetical protein